MATADGVKTKIQGLIDSANAVTGQTDADMSSAVATLIAGYGSSGGDSGAVFYTGTYMTEERVLEDIVFSTPGGVSHFVMFLFDEQRTDTGMAYAVAYIGSKGGRIIGAGSSNAGSGVNAAVCYANAETTNGYYYGVQFGTDSVTLLAATSTVKYCRAPLANKTYIWAAW